jgi:ADP-ribose pyrophosphatase
MRKMTASQFLLFYSISFLCNFGQAEESKEPSVPDSIAQTLPLSSHLTKYLDTLKQFPNVLGPKTSWKNGEIEIILDPTQIKKIEKQVKLRLLSKGCPEEQADVWSSVGIVAEDNYWIWIRDAVIFPSGVYGTYDRLLWKTSLDGPPGVGVLPLLPNNKIVVNLAYRHATRSWEIELPRGQRYKNESIEEAARRELLEETGYSLDKQLYLGTLSPDAGVLNSLVPIYLGKASHSGEKYREFSEAISDNPAFTKEELKEGFSKGYIECPMHGKLIKVACRDACLAYALFQAEIKGHL